MSIDSPVGEASISKRQFFTNRRKGNVVRQKIRRVIALWSLDAGPFESVALENSLDFETQRENVERFEKKRQKVMLGVCGIVLFAIFAALKINDGLVAFCSVGIVVSGLVTIFHSFSYECPNCQHLVEGRAYDLTTGITATKGIRLFPTRCHHCGFYLNLRVLLDDYRINLQEKQPSNQQASTPENDIHEKL